MEHLGTLQKSCIALMGTDRQTDRQTHRQTHREGTFALLRLLSEPKILQYCLFVCNDTLFIINENYGDKTITSVRSGERWFSVKDREEKVSSKVLGDEEDGWLFEAWQV